MHLSIPPYLSGSIFPNGISLLQCYPRLTMAKNLLNAGIAINFFSEDIIAHIQVRINRPHPVSQKKKIPPSRVHPKRKPCIARRYPRLCFALPTSAAVEPRGRPAYLQSDIGFHLKVVGSDMVVYHELSRKKVLKLCFQYMQMRAFYALSFRRCCRLRRNRRC